MSRLFPDPAMLVVPDDAPKNVIELFRQGKWWRTADGAWVRVKTMTPVHRENTAAYLMRNAGKIGQRVSDAEWLATFKWIGSFGYVPDEVLDSMEREDHGRLSNPEKWMKSTPLYRSIAKRRKSDPK